MGSTVKLANDLYLETSSIVHNGELLSDILNKQKFKKLYGDLKTASKVTLEDSVQNYDFILIGMTNNYYNHYQYINILGYDFNGLYSWRYQRLAYFDTENKLVYNGYCNIHDTTFDATGLTLNDDIHITWIVGVKL